MVEYEEHREALETLYIWTGTRMSDKEGAGGCSEDWEKADAVLQRLVLGEEVQWGVSWRKGVIEMLVDGEALGLGRGWSGESGQGVAIMQHYGWFVVGAKGWTRYFLPVFSNVSSTQKWGLLPLTTLGSNYGWESAVAPCQRS